MTCRLPQTPRTPTGAASHYFDDVFTPAGKPAKRHALRRSSTSRSIGFRSDWGETSTNGEEDYDDESGPMRRKNSVGVLDQAALEQKSAMEDRLNHYVSGQLQRIKKGMSEYEPDELETMDDAPDTRGRNGNRKGRKRDDGDYFEQDPYFSK